MQEENNQKELLDLHDLEEIYSLKPSTIIRERWEQKKIAQKKKTYTGKDGKKKTVVPHNTSGFGFTTPAVMNGRKVMYRKADVEKWIAKNTEPLSPEARVAKFA